MCGIIGYSGEKEAVPILLNGLKNLEYRGYDSCGVSVLYENKLHTKKDLLKVREFGKTHSFDSVPGKKGIGHTRWATHGGAKKENAHPHLSGDGKISVVHNGIIENFLEQKRFLEGKGFVFQSETDSEVIPKMIEYQMQKGLDFTRAVKQSFGLLEGQYAVVALHEDGKMVALRKEAPLVVGVGEADGEYFVSSDVTGFLDHSKNAIFLEENDMVVIDDGFSIFNLDKNRFVDRPVTGLDWSAEEAKKGNFEHFYLKEVFEQARVLEDLSKKDMGTILEVAVEIAKAKKVYVVACGTASYGCMHGVYLFSKIAGVHVDFCVASEFHHFFKFLDSESMIFAVSQSGETADTLSAIRIAKSKGAKVVSVTNVVGSSLARESDKVILQGAGPEMAVNSTKAYTSQLAIFVLLAYAVDGRIDEGIEKLRDVPRQISYLTSENARGFVNGLAEKLKDQEHLFLIGRGLQYPTALEAAHKIKEVSYIHTEAFAAGELKHGANALITDGTPYIVFVSEETEKATMNNAMEVKSRGAFLIGVGPKNNDVFDFFIKVPEAGVFNPVVQIIPMQIVAYQLALLRGCDPDFPRNLAKSVTVR